MKKVIFVVSLVIFALVVIIKLQTIARNALQSTVNFGVNTALQQATQFDFSSAKTKDFSTPVKKEKKIEVSAAVTKGNVYFQSTKSIDKLEGTIKYYDIEPTSSYEVDKQGLGTFLFSAKGEKETQLVLQTPQSKKIDIEANLGAGLIQVDGKEMQIENMQLNLGAGKMKVVFPMNQTMDANLNVGSGSIEMEVPAQSARKIIFAQGMKVSNFSFGEDYVKAEGGFETKNFTSAEHKITISLGQGAGGFSINTYEK